MNTCPQGLFAHLERRLFLICSLRVGQVKSLFSRALEEMSSLKAYLPSCYLLGFRGLSAREWTCLLESTMCLELCEILT